MKISVKSRFKLLHRGFENTIVLIPGWATDYRIFENLKLNYNYLLPEGFHPVSFAAELSEALERMSISKVSLFGWSLGGFLATDFYSRNPKRIEELILLGVCRRFPSEALKEIEIKIKKNKNAYLYRFYRDCFSKNDKQGLSWFKKHLLKYYLDTMRLEELIDGLNYLARAVINPLSLAKVKRLRILHGEDDKIVPFEEGVKVKSSLPGAEFIFFKESGHIPFLNHNFKKKFYHG